MAAEVSVHITSCDFCGAESRALVTAKKTVPLPDGWAVFITTDLKGNTVAQHMCAEQVGLIHAVLEKRRKNETLMIAGVPETIALEIVPEGAVYTESS